MTKLFIIGNGFDIAHGLKTTYNDFKDFLLSNYPGITTDLPIVPEGIEQPNGGIEYRDSEVLSLLFYLINEAENDSEYWNEVEYSLGILDFSTIFDNSDLIFEGDVKDDYFKRARRNQGIASMLIAPTIAIQDFFAQWIETINLYLIEPKKDFKMLLHSADQFLTFNYTKTLEKVYEVKEDNVCHIHGERGKTMFFGHGSHADRSEYNLSKYTGSENDLATIDEKLRKKTETALDINSNFFDNLKYLNTDAIYSYGFSFSEVDRVYLIEIFEHINTENIIWYFNDYNTCELNKYKGILKKCGYKGSFDTFHIDM